MVSAGGDAGWGAGFLAARMSWQRVSGSPRPDDGGVVAREAEWSAGWGHVCSGNR